MSSASGHDTVAVGDQGDVTLSIGGAQQLTPELIGAVEAACAQAESATTEPVVVLRLGSPGNRGTADPAAAPAAIHLVNRWERSLRRLERIGAVTIAVVEGDTGGLALEALLSSDYRIGGPDLLLAPFTAAGEPWPGMLVHRLATQIGVAKVRQLVLFGTAVPAARALDVGLIDELTDDIPAALAARVELARGLAGSEVAIRRRLLLEASSTSFEEALGTHLAACDRALRRLQDSAAS